MIELAPPPIGHHKAVTIKPTSMGALRAIWLFTWKPQLTWRRLPMRLVSLLALPFLVYITTSTPKTWTGGHPWVTNPAMQLDGFSRRLGRLGLQLTPDQNSQLLRIFAEEYARAEAEYRQMEPNETGVTPQTEQIKACHERIRERARMVLTERQYPQFEMFEKRKLDESLSRAGERRGWGRTAPFYHWLIEFYFFMILPLNCVRACGALIRDELQADTLGFLTTRPLSRARLLILKYLSQTAWLQMLLLVEALLLFASGHLRQIPGLGSLLPLFLGAQFLAVLAWSGLGAFFGQLTKRYVALAMVYGFIVELGIGSIPTNINTLSMMRHLQSLLGRNPVLQSMHEWSANSVPASVGALALATALFLGLAALLFTYKEYHQTAEMQK